MNSIISSTGMPRKNSSTTVVGMRTRRDSDCRSSAKTTPTTIASTAAVAADCSTIHRPRSSASQISGSLKMTQRAGSS
jgi:hypothetical protein